MGKQNATCIVNAGVPTADHVANAIRKLTRCVAMQVKFTNKFGPKQLRF